MLQRVQSIFLLIVAVAAGVFVSLPLWEKTTGSGETFKLSAWQFIHQLNPTQSQIQPVIYLGIGGLVIAGIALFTIFKFRNRLLQAALCAVNSILMTVILGTSLYIALYGEAAQVNPEDKGSFHYGFYALVAGIVANAMANRFIRKDERTVKESNRMR